MSLMDDTTGTVRYDVRLPPEDSKLGKETLEKYTNQQDLIHSMGEEVVVGIKSCQ